MKRQLLVVTLVLALAAVVAGCDFLGDHKRIPDVIVVPGSDFPYAAHVVSQSKGDYLSCSGTLIGARWVLTEAHCVVNHRTSRPYAPAEVSVALGSGEELSVSQLTIHPNYGGDPHKVQSYDLALLKLAEAASAKPLPMAKSTYPAGTPVLLAGFGCLDLGGSCDIRPGGVKTARTYLGDTEVCNAQLSAVELCAMRPDGTFVARSGDSGAPLIVQTAHGRRLAAVVSGGSEAKNGPLGIDVLMTLELGWVKSTTKIAPVA